MNSSTRTSARSNPIPHEVSKAYTAKFNHATRRNMTMHFATRLNLFLRYALAQSSNYNTPSSRLAGIDILHALREPDCSNIIPGEPNYGANISAMLHQWAMPEEDRDCHMVLNCTTIDGHMLDIMGALRAVSDIEQDPTIVPIYEGTKKYLHTIRCALAAIAWFERWRWTITYNEFARPRFGDIKTQSAFFGHIPQPRTEAEQVAEATR